MRPAGVYAGLVDVPHQWRVQVVLPVRRAPRRVDVQPLLELAPHLEVEVGARAEGEDRPVGDRLRRDEAAHGADVLDAPFRLRPLLGQQALRADRELLDLAQRVDLADGDHGHVATAQLAVHVGAEGTDLDERNIQAHLTEPDHAGGDDLGEVPGQQDDPGAPERLLRELGRVGLELGESLVRRHGGLPARLEAGEVVGQRLGEDAAGHGGVLDRRDVRVGRPAALELGDHQAPVAPESEHRDAVPARSGGRRKPLELEGDHLHGGAQDGGVRQHPLLKIGALLEARFLERDHLRRHRDRIRPP